MRIAPLAILKQTRRNLHHLGLPDPVLASIMTLIEHQADQAPRIDPAAEPAQLARIAKVLHRASLRRSEFLGHKIVDDTSWNMMLDLFAADEEGRAIYVSSLCIASGSAPTTALRHINRLEEAGFVERYADEDDRRRTWLRLTPRAKTFVTDIVLEVSRGLQVEFALTEASVARDDT